MVFGSCWGFAFLIIVIYFWGEWGGGGMGGRGCLLVSVVLFIAQPLSMVASKLKLKIHVNMCCPLINKVGLMSKTILSQHNLVQSLQIKQKQLF